MPSFASRLNCHLSIYKTFRLGIEKDGTYIYRKNTIYHKHILPEEFKWLNILESYRGEIRYYVESSKTIKLHKYFHHLNSSQALTLNLFFPFMETGHSQALLQAMDLPGTAFYWQPEYIVDSSEGTNVDVAWQNTDKQWIYCEVKLTEQEFGTAKNDEHHKIKLRTMYQPVLAPYCPGNLLAASEFFANYQILRNLWLIARDPSASLIFLLPQQNTPLWVSLDRVLKQISPTLRNRTHVVALEALLGTLASAKSTPPHMAWYAKQLTEKYVLHNPAVVLAQTESEC